MHSKGVVLLEEYVDMELNASEKGWNCSSCGLFTDCIGRPLFGKEAWKITADNSSWIENKPKYVFCPNCGKPVRRENHA